MWSSWLISFIYHISVFIHVMAAAAVAAAAKLLQSCPTLCDPIDGSPPGSSVPGILQARTGVGCHFLLQCMKVKSESEVTQSCLTLSDPMDCSLPGSSIHGIFQARVLEWGAIAFSSMSWHILVFHYFLWLNNNPLYGYTTFCSCIQQRQACGLFLIWGYYENASMNIYIQVFTSLG